MTPAGAKNRPDKLPDLYRLLNLEPLEQDKAQLERSLQRVLAQAKAAQAAGAGNAPRLARLFELGKHHLLSAERKSLYDSQWRKVYAGTATNQPATSQPATSQPAWDTRELQPLLPAGDPFAAFQREDFEQQGTDGAAPDYDADFAKLSSLLGADSASDSLQSAATPASASLPSASTSLAESPAVGSPSTPVTATPISRPGAPLVATPSRPPGSLAKQLRKRRERSLLLTAAGLLGSLAAVLALLFVMLNRDNMQDQNEELAGNPQIPVSPANPAANGIGGGPPTAPPKGSGLPQLQGLETPTSSGLGLPSSSSLLDSNSAAENRSGSAMAANDMPTNDAAMQAPAAIAEPPMTDESVVNKPAVPEMPMEAAAPTAQEPVLSDAELAAWQTSLAEVRQTLGEQKYVAAAEQIEAAQALVKTAAQRQALERLTKLKELAEAFQTALVDAIHGMGAGETFTIGSSTPASFVEGDAQHVVVRIRGQNQSFELTQLPLGLAFALADLKLGGDLSLVKASKAAFTIVHPASANNELALQRAKSLLSEAIAAGAVDEDLLNLLNTP